MNEYTRFTHVEATGSLRGKSLIGPLLGYTLSTAKDHVLTEEQKRAYIGITLTASSKTVTLDLPDGAVCIVVNEGGSNAFTLKNVSGDSGTSIAAGKAYLVRASRTANASKLTLLNDGTA